jgi:hypothetical protein
MFDILLVNRNLDVETGYLDEKIRSYPACVVQSDFRSNLDQNIAGAGNFEPILIKKNSW